MLTIKRETAIYAMSPENAPVAHAANGDQIVFETTDCFGGQITKETDRMAGWIGRASTPPPVRCLWRAPSPAIRSRSRS